MGESNERRPLRNLIVKSKALNIHGLAALSPTIKFYSLKAIALFVL